jgi:hypothetical protein
MAFREAAMRLKTADACPSRIACHRQCHHTDADTRA